MSEETKKTKVKFTKIDDYAYLYKVRIDVNGEPLCALGLSCIQTEAPTQVCGTQLVRDLKVEIMAPTPVKLTKPFTAMSANYWAIDYNRESVKKIKELGIFETVKEHLLSKYVEIFCKTNYNIIMGGRINITAEEYEAALGVYSGSLADYIRQKSIGTITASHVYVNPVHAGLSSGGNFALHQTWIWTKPAGWVLKYPDIGVYVNSQNTKQLNDWRAAALKNGSTSVKTDKAFFTPAYTLKLKKVPARKKKIKEEVKQEAVAPLDNNF